MPNYGTGRGWEMEHLHDVLKGEKGAKMTKYMYSLKTSRIREPDFPYNDQQLTCTQELVQFVKVLQDSDIEKMIILYLDAQNKLICIQIMNGTISQAVIYPREIIKHAILAGASAIILVHNHPSGVLKPSEADIHLTRKMQEVGKIIDVLVHDHLIVAEDRFFSFREEGLM
jgi:DNA repair protein RadC